MPTHLRIHSASSDSLFLENDGLVFAESRLESSSCADSELIDLNESDVANSSPQALGEGITAVTPQIPMSARRHRMTMGSSEAIIPPPSYEATTSDQSSCWPATHEKAREESRIGVGQSDESFNSIFASMKATGFRGIIKDLRISAQERTQIRKLVKAANQAQTDQNPSQALMIYKLVIGRLHSSDIEYEIFWGSETSDAIKLACKYKNNSELLVYLVEKASSDDYTSDIKYWMKGQITVARSALVGKTDDGACFEIQSLNKIRKKVAPNQSLAELIDENGMAAFALADRFKQNNALACLLAADEKNAIAWISSLKLVEDDRKNSSRVRIMEYAIHRDLGPELARQWNFDGYGVSEAKEVLSVVKERLKVDNSRQAYVNFLDTLARQGSKMARGFTMLMIDDDVAPHLTETIKRWIMN